MKKEIVEISISLAVIGFFGVLIWPSSVLPWLLLGAAGYIVFVNNND